MPQWVKLLDAADCPEGAGRELAAAGRLVALFRVGGEFYALDGVCPHQGGPLGKGQLAGCVVTCPWHGWQFDVRSGAHGFLPTVRQPAFPTKVEGGAVYVELPDEP